MKAFQNKIWDGKIRLFNTQHNTIYFGLIDQVLKFAEARGYAVEVAESIESADKFSYEDAEAFAKTLNIPKITPKDYQLKYFSHAIRNRRAILLSPTASGKSLILYMIMRYLNKKTLIIVPQISLVRQLYTDFEEYGFDSLNNVHQVMGGTEKSTDLPITISTWQSIFKQPKSWFKQFDVVIGDEAHEFKAKSLTTIMEALTETPYRIGLTGTLDGTQTNKLVLEGLFGAAKRYVTTKQLMDEGALSELKIKSLVLKHSPETCKLMKKATYAEEINYLVYSEARNNFIKNLAISLKGNTLILYTLVEKHGKNLNRIISAAVEEGRSVYLIHGNVGVDERERIRKIVETENDAIIIASYKTFSTGINIKNLHNVIFASPHKGVIKIMQSLGRTLRLHKSKDYATLYDIADDMTQGTRKNYTLEHCIIRLKLYAEEKFNFKMFNINLKD
jgi:superfamily II DNA or RNA helicase